MVGGLSSPILAQRRNNQNTPQILKENPMLTTKRERKLKDALRCLNDLIDAGCEYPDAEYKAAQQHKVDATELRKAYDSQHT
jgi:hypothetical protein